MCLIESVSAHEATATLPACLETLYHHTFRTLPPIHWATGAYSAGGQDGVGLRAWGLVGLGDIRQSESLFPALKGCDDGTMDDAA